MIELGDSALDRAHHQIHHLQNQLREVTAERDLLRREREALDAALGRQVLRAKQAEERLVEMGGAR